jgi:hypothetical protein
MPRLRWIPLSFAVAACGGHRGGSVPAPAAPLTSSTIEQTTDGTRDAIVPIASFDGLGVGFAGQAPPLRNPSDNALAVGPDHIVQIVNSQFAVFTKKGATYDTTGRLLKGAVPTNSLFKGFGGQCEARNNGIYVWLFHVDWTDTTRTRVTGPVKIAVAPYDYLCGGQLTHCVPQPDTLRKLDAQGDKLMNRVVYRRIGTRESIVALHSVNTAARGGGVRWYEFRIGEGRAVRLQQQGTYAPGGFYRWMGSMGMDAAGNISMGYSFGGTPHFAGQRMTGRASSDAPGRMGFRETVLAEGEDSQRNTMRWEDYAALAMDPDDCTFWYVGDYYKKGAGS